jgi:hypothetical protein
MNRPCQSMKFRFGDAPMINAKKSQDQSLVITE